MSEEQKQKAMQIMDDLKKALIKILIDEKADDLGPEHFGAWADLLAVASQFSAQHTTKDELMTEANKFFNLIGIMNASNVTMDFVKEAEKLVTPVLQVSMSKVIACALNESNYGNFQGCIQRPS